MQVSDLRNCYSPKRRRLLQLWTVVPPAPQKTFAAEAEILWDSVWTAQHRRVLMSSLINSSVSDALTVVPGHNKEAWEALIR